MAKKKKASSKKKAGQKKSAIVRSKKDPAKGKRTVRKKLAAKLRAAASGIPSSLPIDLMAQADDRPSSGNGGNGRAGSNGGGNGRPDSNNPPDDRAKSKMRLGRRR